MADEEKGKKKGAKKGGSAKNAPKKQESEQKAPVVVEESPVKIRYREQAIAQLMERFNYSNKMQVPGLEKVVVNMGVGETTGNSKAIDGAVTDLQAITGQAPNIRKARVSISNFKLRAGTPVGAAVTLRRARMWEFMDRLLTFAVPRIRDFRGLPRRGFDGRGNYTIGLKEQLIFPEIEFDKVDQMRGMNITFVTSAQTDEEGYELLSAIGVPFTREESA